MNSKTVTASIKKSNQKQNKTTNGYNIVPKMVERTENELTSKWKKGNQARIKWKSR